MRGSSKYARGRDWPGVLIGDLLANDYSVLPLGSALGQTCGNVLEVLIATLLLRRLVRHGSPLASVRGVGAIAVSIAKEKEARTGGGGGYNRGGSGGGGGYNRGGSGGGGNRW